MRLLWSWHTPEAKHFTGVRPNTQETQSVKIQDMANEISKVTFLSVCKNLNKIVCLCHFCLKFLDLNPPSGFLIL